MFFMFLECLPSAFLTVSEVVDLCYGQCKSLVSFTMAFNNMLARHCINCSQKICY